jgi:hypothetical protein
MKTTMKNKERIFIFIAYSDHVPFFSTLFLDHTEMKIFSGKHSGKYKNKVKNYTSTYLDLTKIPEFIYDFKDKHDDLLEEICGLVENDFCFNMNVKTVPVDGKYKTYTQKEAREMAYILGKVYHYAHQIHCDAHKK